MYRILTEYKNIEGVNNTLLGLGLLNYTLYFGKGSWNGHSEKSLIIELDNITKGLARRAARSIKALNKQEKVLLQEIPVTSQLV